MEDPDTIVDSQPWTQGSTHDVTSVWAPLAVAGIGRFYCNYFLQRPSVPNIHCTGQIAKTGR